MSTSPSPTLRETASALGIITVITFVVVGVCGLLLYPLRCVIAICDVNPPIEGMKAFYEIHEEDFAQARLVLESQTCFGCPAPKEILEWAGAEATIYACTDKNEPRLYQLITDHGTFSYIPNQEELPRGWNPCTGSIAQCFAKIDDEWFSCSRTID